MLYFRAFGWEETGLMTPQQRKDLLATYGATGPEVEELLAYNRNAFDRHGIDTPPVLPLPAEPHVAAWERYALEAAETGRSPPCNGVWCSCGSPSRRASAKRRLTGRRPLRGRPRRR